VTYTRATGGENRIPDRRCNPGGRRFSEPNWGFRAGKKLNPEFRHVGHAQHTIGVEVGILRLPVDELRSFMQGHPRSPRQRSLHLRPSAVRMNDGSSIDDHGQLLDAHASDPGQPGRIARSWPKVVAIPSPTSLGIGLSQPAFWAARASTAASSMKLLPLMWAVSRLPRVKTNNQVDHAGDQTQQRRKPTFRPRAHFRSHRPTPSRWRLCPRSPLGNAVDGYFWSDETEAHRKSDRGGRHAVSDCRVYEFQRHMGSVGKLQEAASHSE